jgi:plastocyanin
VKGRFLPAAAGLLVAAGLSAPASTGQPAPEPVSDAAIKRVLVKDNFFDPRSLTVRVGARVKWVWRGENEHNVTFVKVPPHASKRGVDARRDGHFVRGFRRPGLYKYVCTLHYGMRGTINVLRGGAALLGRR